MAPFVHAQEPKSREFEYVAVIDGAGLMQSVNEKIWKKKLKQRFIY
jgi:hypothetical protein